MDLPKPTRENGEFLAPEDMTNGKCSAVVIDYAIEPVRMNGRACSKVRLMLEVRPGEKRVMDLYDWSSSYNFLYNATVGQQKPIVGRTVEIRLKPAKDGKLYREIVSVY